MKTKSTILLLCMSFLAMSQISVKENLFSKEYYNQDLRIDKHSFELIIKGDDNAWLNYKKVKPYRITARCFDGIALGSFAVAIFQDKKQFYYYGLGSAGMGFIFDLMADSKLSDAILITNASMGFKMKF